MRTRLTTIFDRYSRLGAWIAVAGTFLLVGGLIWDVSIHAGNPGLAGHESVFTIDNPAHVVFLAGIGLIVVGMLGFLGGQVRAARSSRGSRLIAVAAVSVSFVFVATVGAVSAVETQFAAAAPAGAAGHVHGAAGSAAALHHATIVTDGPGCQPPGTPPTAAQRAAAAELLATVRATWLPSLTTTAARALGYVAPKVPGKDPVLVHYGNRGLANATSDLMDPARPQALVYLHLPDGATVLGGVLFTAPIGQGPCPGGSTTLWHYHQAGATREMIHVWLFDNPSGPFSTGIGGKAGIQVAERELVTTLPS